MSALILRYGNPVALPLDLLLSSIPSLPRRALDRLVERAIEELDQMDGDPDLEPAGDELDGTNAEDEGLYLSDQCTDGPGCPVSDPGGGSVDDEGEADDGV